MNAVVDLDRELAGDPDLRMVRQVSREAAADLRGRALAVDAEPDRMEPHLDSAAFRMIRRSSTPNDYREESGPGDLPPMRAGSVLRHAVGSVELARGDTGTMLACPAPNLAGVFVELLGDEQQKTRFFTRLHDGRTWTFFGMTEPERGSDAGSMTTRLERAEGGGWRLHGRKRFIGGAARGGIGVVFARTGRSPFSIRAVLVETTAPGFTARRIDTLGLRGAATSEIELDGVPVDESALLGEHLPLTRRGLWAAMRTFNAVRVQVAANAVGTASALVEHVTELRPGAPGARTAAARVAAVHRLVLTAGARIDRDPDRGYPASAAKLTAARTAVATADWARAAVGPGGLLDHPLVEKWIRDSYAYEYMEGTANIGRLHLVRGYQAGDAGGPSDEGIAQR